MAYTTIRFGSDYNQNAGVVETPGGLTVIGHPPTNPNALYPRTQGGVTFGIPSGALTTVASTGWASGDDVRLRGRTRISNPSVQDIRIDVTPGNYRVILGGAAAAYQRNRWRVLDTATPTPVDFSFASQPGFWPDDNATTSTDQWVDHNGVVRSIGADALVATPAVVTISTGQLVIRNGGHASGSFVSDLSFIAWEPVAAPPSSGAARMMYQLLA